MLPQLSWIFQRLPKWQLKECRKRRHSESWKYCCFWRWCCTFFQIQIQISQCKQLQGNHWHFISADWLFFNNNNFGKLVHLNYNLFCTISNYKTWKIFLPAIKDSTMVRTSTHALSFIQILRNAVKTAISRRRIPNIPKPRTALSQSWKECKQWF